MERVFLFLTAGGSIIALHESDKSTEYKRPLYVRLAESLESSEPRTKTFQKLSFVSFTSFDDA